MTPALLIARECIIYWVNVWLAPVEFVSDEIESELARRNAAAEDFERPAQRREITTGGATC